MRVIAAVVLVTLIWGLYYLGVDLALHSGWNANWMNALRFLIAAAVLIFLVSLRGETREMVEMQRRSFWKIIITAWVGVLIGMWLLTAGQERIDSGIAGTIASLVPLFAALLALLAIFGRKRLLLRGWIGIALGLLGVVFLYSPWSASSPDLLGVLLVLAGTFFLALEAHFFNSWFAEQSLLLAITLVVLWSGIGFALLAIFSPLETGSWIPLILLALLSNALAYLLYLWLIRRRGPVWANLYSYLTPVVALGAGVLFNNEAITLAIIFGAGLCIGGALLLGVSREEMIDH